MITIFHNPKCRKSRAGLLYLQENNIEHQVIEYLKHTFDEKSLKDLLMKLNKTPFDIVRTQEEDYKQHYKNKKFTDDEWIQILLDNPRLIQRPIIVKDYKAIIGQDYETIDAFLKPKNL